MEKITWIYTPKRTKDVKQTEKQYAKAGIKITLDLFMCNIGKQVAKTTSTLGSQPRPFKSGSKVNIVKDVIVHPIMWEPAYIFEEDDSYVLCRKCYLISKEDLNEEVITNNKNQN